MGIPVGSSFFVAAPNEMEAHDASKSNMMNFSGSAGDMLAAMEAAGIKAPDAADAALKVAEAPASSAPVNCEDPSCAVDHSHGNHSSIGRDFQARKVC